jgi:MFS family permease
MALDSRGKIPLRLRLAVYGSGMFSDGGTQVVIPLWLILLDPSPLMFGIVIGGRSFLPLLLSIHGGALMDRLGARRVMLFFALVSLIMPFVYPLMPWVWAVLVLNMVTGLATTMNWVGAQTLVGQEMGGNPEYARMLSFANRLGTIICPLLAGAAWDIFGPWGGFGIMAAWGLGLLIAALAAPDTQSGGHETAPALHVGDLMPKLSDYVSAFKLLAIPGVALVAVGSTLNIASGAIQGSFFIAYLEQIGFSGTLIGVLVTSGSICAAFGTLTANWYRRWCSDLDVLNVAVIIAIVMIGITPLFVSFLPLFLAVALRGVGQGTSQPFMISIPAKSVSKEAQGAVVGLRMSLNRLVQTVVPVLMGVSVELIGLEQSFFVICGILTLVTVIFTFAAWGKLADEPEMAPATSTGTGQAEKGKT